MSIWKFWLTVFSYAFMPLYLGGGTKSSNSQASTTQDNRSVTTTTNTSYDLSDRSYNASQTNSNNINTTNQSYDLSNRSTSNLWDNSNTNSNNTSNSNNTTNQSYDLSDRSTSNLFDSSVKNSNNTTTTNYTTTDGGAVAGALDLAASTLAAILGVTNTAQLQSSDLARTALETSATATATGYHYAEGLFNDSLDFARQADTRIVAAYDAAQKASGNAMSQLQSAYADAKGTSGAQEKIILAVLAVAGVFALSALRR